MDFQQDENLFPEDFGASRPLPNAHNGQVPANQRPPAPPATGYSGASPPNMPPKANSGKWACAACTLENQAGVGACKACGTPNPNAGTGGGLSGWRGGLGAATAGLTAASRDQAFRGDPSGVGALPRWVPDEEVTHCTQCQVMFDWAVRKHHCRACGRIFCQSCSENKALLPKEFCDRDPKRVCDPCFRALQPLQDELVATMSNSIRENHIDPNSALERHVHNPFSTTLGACVRKAAHTILNMTDTHTTDHINGMGVVKDQSIPIEYLRRARGLAFLTVAKMGFVLAGKAGTGLVVARRPDGGWTAPSAIATVGVNWGLLIGGEITDYVILLNTQKAVEAFSGRGQVTLGAELGAALGPVGRNAGGNLALGDGGVAPTYTYSHSKGLFVGVSLEGTVIAARADMNQKFYGQPVLASNLLNGVVPNPRAAQPLYDALETACAAQAPRNAITERVGNLSDSILS
uniref:FYVE-type domain-containing protein n=3 Tax=Heterosigma akashiwo TaxID=2829 RepID=A0A6V1LWE2_HETAK|mmetsp:Transcript_14276/g.19684  ORF Transcript_14276/g.19684 Transcript_14276/m.19684 type:complete len:462 (-) Transcript_14276:94-1479(-)